MTTTNLFSFALMVAGALLGLLVVLSLLVSLMERSHRSKREARLKFLREEPSKLTWLDTDFSLPKTQTVAKSHVPTDFSNSDAFLERKPAKPVMPVLDPLATQELTAFVDDEDEEEEEAIPPAPGPVTPVEVVSSTSPTSEPDLFLDTKASIGEKTRRPFQGTMEFGFDYKALENKIREAGGEQIPTSSIKTGKPADQVLYLDPDFELAEIKRILRIWQLVPDDDTGSDQLGRWRCDDGTMVELFSAKGGEKYPYMEIRGPMAEDLALYLPEDLPIHPYMPSDLS